jgi:hypothetical protein
MRKQAKISEAANSLLKAVNALLDIGYETLSEDEKRACSWANMARELLVHNVKPSESPAPYIKPECAPPAFKVGGATKTQQVRMDKAVRAVRRIQNRSGNSYY